MSVNWDGLDDLDSAPTVGDYLADQARRAQRPQPKRFGPDPRVKAVADHYARTGLAEAVRSTWREEHADVVAYIEDKAEKRPDWDFPRSLLKRLNEVGSLSEGQLEGIQKCMQRDADRAANVPVSVAGKGFTLLLESFQRAKASKLKYPKLKFEKFVISMAGDSVSKNPGCLYIKQGAGWESVYLGKISPEGVFSPSRDCSAEVREEVARIGGDPLGEAVKHGHKTGNCCACSKTLTDPESVRLGIGPVCRKKWFGGAL